MLTVALVVVLAAAPEVKLGSPGLTGVQISKEVAGFYSDHLAQQISMRGIRVVTPSEIASLVGLERQKQLMGCDQDTASCVAEISNALGVDGIITGSVGKFGGVFQINVKVVSSNDARQLAVFSATASSEAAVLSTLTDAADEMVPAVRQSLAPSSPAETAGEATAVSTTSRLRRWSLGPAALGVVAAAVGTGLMISVADIERRVRGPGDSVSTLSYGEASFEIQRAGTMQGAAIACFVVTGVALVAAGAMFLFGSRSDTLSALLAAAREGAFALGGGWW